MRLGIIGAMDVEVDIIKSKMERVLTTSEAGIMFHQGFLNGLRVVVCTCGVGKVNAALCTQILCSCYDVTHIINTGVAGALDPLLDVGDIVVSDDVIHHDVDCTAVGYDECELPGVRKYFKADPSFRRLAFMIADSVHPYCYIERVASGDQFVATRRMKRRIAKRTGAGCVEMEGAAIAQVAHRNGIPFVILRTISDKADNSAKVDYPTFEEKAARTSAQVVMEIARRLHDSEGGEKSEIT